MKTLKKNWQYVLGLILIPLFIFTLIRSINNGFTNYVRIDGSIYYTGDTVGFAVPMVSDNLFYGKDLDSLETIFKKADKLTRFSNTHGINEAYQSIDTINGLVFEFHTFLGSSLLYVRDVNCVSNGVKLNRYQTFNKYFNVYPKGLERSIKKAEKHDKRLAKNMKKLKELL
jgi:hypothetical protein